MRIVPALVACALLIGGAQVASADDISTENNRSSMFSTTTTSCFYDSKGNCVPSMPELHFTPPADHKVFEGFVKGCHIVVRSDPISVSFDGDCALDKR